jgi:biotin carboxyl carrier protein
MNPQRRPGRKAYLFVTLFAFLLVLFPFVFWYSTWFGRKLSDSEIDRYLADKTRPRRAQHALVQIGERLSRHRDVSRWYAGVIAQSSSPKVELREMAAWIMGQDTRYPPFHQALLTLLGDGEAMVRRNAALALAAFGDPAGREELLGMLRPRTVAAASAGRLKYRVKAGDYVNPGTLLARIGAAEVRATVPGELRALTRTDGAGVRPGDALAEISPDQSEGGHAWEALRALYLVGQPSDLEDCERFTGAKQGIPRRLSDQAAETVQAIRTRAAAR